MLVRSKGRVEVGHFQTVAMMLSGGAVREDHRSDSAIGDAGHYMS